MKKSSFIILTLLASLSFEVCQAQDVNASTPIPTKADTVIADESDTVRYYYPQQTYNYYYRSRLWDNLFRIFFTRRYYTTIQRPGYIPRHVRIERSINYATNHSGHGHSGVPHRRGGFGHFGSHHSVVG